MKKLLGIILTLAMILTTLSVAYADEFPQPEGGKKFEGDWAAPGGKVSIDYEEEGYRVYLEMYDKSQLTGTVWQYNCYYVEEADVLESVSSSKSTYTLDPDTFDQAFGEEEYNDFDSVGQVTVFAINEEGNLTWSDGRADDVLYMIFQPIGRFGGIWKNEAEEVYVEINWEGMNDEETFFYTVYIRRGADDQAVEYNMQGLYNQTSGKLEAKGTATTFVSNGQGGFDPVKQPEIYDAFFLKQDSDKLLYEMDKDIELDYFDPMMENS